MKLLLTNTVTSNGGDSAILHAIIYALRQQFGKNTEFIIYDNLPEAVKRHYPNLTLRQQLFLSIANSPLRSIRDKVMCVLKLIPFYLGVWCLSRKLISLSRLLLTPQQQEDIRHYRHADLIVSTGGTYLVENYHMLPRILDFKITLLLGKPLALFTQSLGPFKKPWNRYAFRKIFNKSIAIFVRDTASYENLQDLGIEMSKVHIFPDIAFALNKVKEQLTDNKEAKKRDFTVGISLRPWTRFKNSTAKDGMEKYLHVIAEVVKTLTRKYKANVVFVSTCQGIAEYEIDDSQTAGRLYKMLADDVKSKVSVDHEFHSPFELMEILANFDFVISTRMHMSILSLIQDIPVLPIAYEFKIDELFKKINLSQYVQNIETLEVERFLSTLDSFIEDMPKIREQIKGEVAKQKELALQSADKLWDIYCNLPDWS